MDNLIRITEVILGVIALVLLVIGVSDFSLVIVSGAVAIFDLLLIVPTTKLFLWCCWVYVGLPVRQDDLVRKSAHYFPQDASERPLSGKRFRPLYVPREFLDRRWFWKLFGGRWSYSTLVLDDKIILEFDNNSYTMTVDLETTTHGIYNSVGRRFIFDRLQSSASAAEVEKKLEKWLKTPTRRELVSLTGSPLVWCGGGVLPVVKYENFYWVLLYFRDLRPVGLGSSVGGSENAKERTKLLNLLIREFCEETVILTSKPERRKEVDQVRFSFGEDLMRVLKDEELERRLLGLEFTKKYSELRRREEDVVIAQRHDALQLPVVSIPSPFRITVSEDGKPNSFENMIFVVTPLDGSIDCYRVIFFDLDGYYPLYGEVAEEGYPQRNPIVLVKLDFLRDAFDDNGGKIGRSVEGAEGHIHPGCRILGNELGSDSFLIFDQDLELAKARHSDLAIREEDLDSVERDELRYLVGKANVSVSRPEVLRDILVQQATRQPVKKNVNSGPFFAMVGPTWRTLEMALRYTCLRSSKDLNSFVESLD